VIITVLATCENSTGIATQPPVQKYILKQCDQQFLFFPFIM
jgi:hypothetical protein